MGDDNKKTILLVEDEAITARVVKKTLDKCGYNVIHAESGEKAFEMFDEKNEIDLVLMDINLGDGIDGTETALKILKKQSLPVVFLSSHAESEIVEKTGRVASYGYVIKNTGISVIDITIKMAFKLFIANEKIRCSEELLHQKNNELKKANEELRAAIEEMETANEELNATIEEFEATNEELIATNEQLTESEKALEQSEALYRALFNLTPVIVSLSKLEDGTLVDVNDAFLEISGYSREEIIGKTSDSLGFWVDDGEYNMIRSELSGKGRYANREIRLRFKQGEKIHDTIQSARVVEIMGNKYAVAVTQDITDLKKTEKEKRLLEERLQRAEKMEALGLLAGGVAHDLNNALGIVVGYAELILMNSDKANPFKSELTNIMNGSIKAAEIVQDLLTMARRGVSGRSILNLNKIIVDCQQSPEFRKISSYHPNVKIVTNIEPDLLNISGSAVHLGKILYNLVLNAGEAMPEGGVVTIKTVNRYMDRPVEGYDMIREGDYVVLTVTDTGEGIPGSDLKRIFEPFYTKKFMGRSGTGLGLSIVWGTVKDHNGYINVESEVGRGTTFSIYFPASRSEITREVLPSSMSEYIGNGESVLIVDDVKEQRDLAALMLKKLNYNVTCSSSGEEAIAYLKKNRADMVVLDMIMDPGMDGLDTYRSIIEIHPGQKAIIVSGFSESERVSETQKLGAGVYVKKPYVMEKLGLAVKEELNKI